MPTKPYVTLQKRKYGKNGVIYFQWRINIPQEIIEIVGWDKNDEIKLIINDIIDGKEIICRNRVNYSKAEE